MLAVMPNTFLMHYSDRYEGFSITTKTLEGDDLKLMNWNHHKISYPLKLIFVPLSQPKK